MQTGFRAKTAQSCALGTSPNQAGSTRQHASARLALLLRSAIGCGPSGARTCRMDSARSSNETRMSLILPMSIVPVKSRLPPTASQARTRSSCPRSFILLSRLRVSRVDSFPSSHICNHRYLKPSIKIIRIFTCINMAKETVLVSSSFGVRIKSNICSSASRGRPTSSKALLTSHASISPIPLISYLSNEVLIILKKSLRSLAVKVLVGRLESPRSGLPIM